MNQYSGAAGQGMRRPLARRAAAGAVGASARWALAACGAGGSAGTGSARGSASVPPRPAALGGKIQVAHRTDTLTIEMYGGLTEDFKKRPPTCR